jgi:hypothetical protein
MKLPTQIQPAVGQALITKVSRLFNGTASDVLNELFQNARRAGATRIDVGLGECDGRPALLITDDGSGIDDPASFVTLGQSGWNSEIAHREDPAGMGVFSLAAMRVTVRSFSKAANAGWAVTIPEDGWEGAAPLAVGSSAILRGTQIVIAMPDAWRSSLEIRLKAAAKHFPLPIRYQGEILHREDFLERACRVEEWQGCRIGVFRTSTHEPADTPRINFHGVTVPCRMPDVREIEAAQKWTVRIDIVDAPALQLVLPARKEMVENAALAALRAEALAAIYRTIALEDEHRLSFQDWRRAADLGVELPEASPWLHAWRPRTAEHRHRELNERIISTPMVVLADHQPDIEQCAVPALSAETLGYRPVCEIDGFSGYDWYDRLPRIPALSFAVEIEGRRLGYSDQLSIPSDVGSGHVDAIMLVVSILGPAASKEPAALLSFPLDMLVCANEGWSLGEAHVFVRDKANVEPSELARLIEACCFCFDEDGDCDSWDTQHRDFERDARAIANAILLGADDALLERIRSVFLDEIQCLIPQDRQITLTASGNYLSVAFAAPA